MSGDVPQFPGKGGVATPGKPGPTQAVPGWQKAICPLLTAGEIARKPVETVVQIAGVQAAPVKAQACIGPNCMWFVSVTRADGLEMSGCAPVHQLQQQQALTAMVARFMQAAEAGAAAEAAAKASPAVGAVDAAAVLAPATPT